MSLSFIFTLLWSLPALPAAPVIILFDDYSLPACQPSFQSDTQASALALPESIPAPQQKYIDTYAVVAVREMYRSGVPASITLAQGILESGSGRSRLATEGNNHFGIKCHDWKGKSMKADDDAKGECFRVYDDAEHSFRDHSDFLRYRDRYKFLFEYETTDYKSWSYGLKKAGYATSPSYAEALIRIIEDYGLSKYDTMTEDDLRNQVNPEIVEIQESLENLNQDEQHQPGQNELNSGKDSRARKDSKAQKKQKDKKNKKSRNSHKTKKQNANAQKNRDITDIAEAETVEIPDSPLSIEEAKPFIANASESYTFSLSRQLAAKNGVPFIYAVEGDTYESIAQNNRLFLNEILSYNDLTADESLLPGTIVYLQPKKNQAPKGLDMYVVEEDGESLRDICQRFAVRMKSICRINAFEPGHLLRAGDTVLLRKRGKHDEKR